MIYNKKRGACEAWAQMAWLATSGTQEGRIAHHHTDATVLRKRSGKAERRTSWLYLVPFLGAKIQVVFITSKYLGCFFYFVSFLLKVWKYQIIIVTLLPELKKGSYYGISCI